MEESLHRLGFAGIACVLLGIVLLAMPGKDKQLKSSLSEGLFWGVLTGVFIASYSSLDGFAIQLIGLTPLMYYVPGMAVRLFLLGLGFFPRNRGVKALKKTLKALEVRTLHRYCTSGCLPLGFVRFALRAARICRTNPRGFHDACLIYRSKSPS